MFTPLRPCNSIIPHPGSLASSAAIAHLLRVGKPGTTSTIHCMIPKNWRLRMSIAVPLRVRRHYVYNLAFRSIQQCYSLQRKCIICFHMRRTSRSSTSQNSPKVATILKTKKAVASQIGCQPKSTQMIRALISTIFWNRRNTVTTFGASHSLKI